MKFDFYLRSKKAKLYSSVNELGILGSQDAVSIEQIALSTTVQPPFIIKYDIFDFGQIFLLKYLIQKIGFNPRDEFQF